MKQFKTPKGTELPLLDMRGKPYLQVAHRLVWFREEHPDWTIETSLAVEQGAALGRAVIKDATGRVMSTAHKYEDKAGFADYREKAETGAIGRALALVGYGTQFCADELDEGARLADSPVPVARVTPQQPAMGDGIPRAALPYRVDFGKYAKRSLEEIYKLDEGSSLDQYANWLEQNSAKTGKPLGEPQVIFIQRAREFLENQWATEPGAAG